MRLLAALLLLVAAPAVAQTTATVTVDPARVIGTLPEEFLGLSFEMAALSNASLDPDEGNVARLLTTLSPRGQLRFGGTLLDTQAWWRTPGRAAPDWSRYIVEHANIDALARLARRTGWRVEMGVNLKHFDPATADDQARYVAAALGPSLMGFACGNEPDLFEGGRDWAAQRPFWERCADAVAPHGPLVGGEEADGLRPAMLATSAKRLALATSHFYAQYENCGSPRERRRFTIADLLGPATVRRSTDRLSREVALARAVGLPYRVSESNTAACLKQAGVGDVYAAALWAVDYQLLAASLGVTGVNMHVPWEGWRLCDVPITYVALCARTPSDLAQRRLAPNPLYYGMLAVGSVRPGQFLATSVRATANLTAYTVRAADGAVQVVLVEKSAPGGPPMRVTLAGLPGGEATIRTLSAPSLTSRGEAVRFAGAQVAADGSFTPGLPGRARRLASGYALSVPAGSVAIVTIAAPLPAVTYTDTSRFGRPFAKDPSVVRFNGRYLLYYSVPGAGGQGSTEGWSIGIASSPDNIRWTKAGELHPEQAVEAKGIAAPNAIVHGGRVHLFYQTYGNGVRDAIAHAWSDDGVHFTRDPTNPIYRPADQPWSSGRAIDADVVIHGDQARLYYATRDPTMTRQMIGVAQAPLAGGFAAGTWRDASGGGPILKPELPWERNCIEAPSVVKRGDAWVMFYAGGYNNEPQQIGAATSRDGIHWKRVSDQPVLANGAPGSWNVSESGHPGAFVDRGRTWLYYQGNADQGKSWLIARAAVRWRGATPVVLP